LTLEMEGYQVLTASDGLEALGILQRIRPDLVIADIMMPRMDGYELYEVMRQDKRWLAIPFIFLTAKGEKQDIRLGKQMGADDYLTKPFEPEDLIAAVHGKLKRMAEITAAVSADEKTLEDLLRERVLQVQDLILDTAKRTVTVRGQPVHLTPMEFDLLAYMMRNVDRVLSCRQLVQHTHDYECPEEEAREIIRPHIKNLRRKIEEDSSHPRYIINVRGVGYKLVSGR